MNTNRRQRWTVNALLIVLLLLFYALASQGAQAQPRPPKGYIEATVVRVKDGDTLTVQLRFRYEHRIEAWHEVVSSHTINMGPFTLRPSRYDTWEVSRSRRSSHFLQSLLKLHNQTSLAKAWEMEIIKGRAATIALEELLSRGKLYVLPVGAGPLVYGRYPARLVVVTDTDVVRVDEYLQAGGHTRE